MSQNPNLPNKVLVVDDDPTVAQSLEAPLTKYQIATLKASALDGALYLFNQTRLDVVLVELDFDPLPGLALIQKWREHEVMEKRFTGFIAMLSSQRTNGQDGLIKELGDVEIITKPINALHLIPVIIRAMQNKQRMVSFYETKSKLIDPYLKSGQVDKAIDMIKKKLPELGDKGKVMLVDLYEQTKQNEQAMSVVSEMLKTDQNNSSLINTGGRLLMKMGKLQEARAYMEKADAMAPQNIQRLNEMATLYLQLREPDKSVAKFKDVLALHPEKPEIKFDMFAKLYEAGFDKHATDFGKTHAQPMEIVRHYNNKGVLMSKDGKTEDALSEYDRALKFFPKFKDNYRILYNMALAEVNKKTAQSYAKAKDHLKKCLELKPDFDKAIATLASIEKMLAKTPAPAAAPVKNPTAPASSTAAPTKAVATNSAATNPAAATTPAKPIPPKAS